MQSFLLCEFFFLFILLNWQTPGIYNNINNCKIDFFMKEVQLKDVMK